VKRAACSCKRLPHVSLCRAPPDPCAGTAIRSCAGSTTYLVMGVADVMSVTLPATCLKHTELINQGSWLRRSTLGPQSLHEGASGDGNKF
jgi:hypothetical protein